MSNSRTVYVLSVDIPAANNIPLKKDNKNPSPFVEISVYGKTGFVPKVFNTFTQQDTCNPKFEYKSSILLLDEPKQLNIKVLNDNFPKLVPPSEFIGSATLDIGTCDGMYVCIYVYKSV